MDSASRSDSGKDRKLWREPSREKKESEYGLTNLWNPITRAKLCLSCHIGNVAESKVVTHAMYAAGHPPLPGFEMATFGREMPQHWELLKEKRAREMKDKTNILKLVEGKPEDVDFEQTKLVLVNGVMTLHASMSLVAGQSDSAKKNAWPELAQFDCFACHHDLKTPSWRQQRGYVGKPGRPQMQRWPLELVKLSLRLLGEDEKQLDARMKEAYEAFDAQPFGKTQDIHKAASKVVSWSDALSVKLVKKNIDHAAALGLLRGLCAIPQQTFPTTTRLAKSSGRSKSSMVS